jgi:CTD kinase subunit beta
MMGGSFSLDNYIAIRIALNKEATLMNLPRHTEWIDAPKSVSNGGTNGSNHPTESPALSGSNKSPTTPPAMTLHMATGAARGRVGERGQDGTVRFMLEAERARTERETVAKYFAADEYEEYEEEIDVPIGQ